MLAPLGPSSPLISFIELVSIRLCEAPDPPSRSRYRPEMLGFWEVRHVCGANLLLVVIFNGYNLQSLAMSQATLLADSRVSVLV